MAHIEMTYRSEQLACDTDISLHLPEGIQKGERLPVLYLLHGLGSGSRSWDKYTAIGRYVRNKKIIVVMPYAGKSFYMNEKYGLNYYEYIAKELTDMVEATFPASDRRFIAGASMGGYGAFRIAFKNPGRYEWAASFSGALDMKPLLKLDEKRYELIAGSKFVPEEQDLFTMAELADQSPVKPKFYQWCGTEDYLYKGNVKFKNFMETLSFDYTYAESPGDHSWVYWDREIEKTLKLFGF